jgi:hypothetical protein
VIAEATVHTSGINWESVSVTIASVATIMGLVTGWVGNRIKVAINQQTEMLEAKLESKETVASIDRRLTRVEDRLRIREAGRGKRI